MGGDGGGGVSEHNPGSVLAVRTHALCSFQRLVVALKVVPHLSAAMWQIGFASGAVDLHILDVSLAGRSNEDPMTEAAMLEEALGS